jgi:hypothetical protein
MPVRHRLPNHREEEGLMGRVLVVANETIGGRQLVDHIRELHENDPDLQIVVCVPRTNPKHGNIIYDEAVYQAAQVRVDLARVFLREQMGIDAVGEVGDPDPYTAAMDAVREWHPDAVVVSTKPSTSSGWLKRDLLERIEEATGLPVRHVVSDVEAEGLPFHVTLVVANRTTSSDVLLNHLREQAKADTPHLFVIVVPQEGGSGKDFMAARGRLGQMLDKLRRDGVLAAGLVGDPDPYTATMQGVQFFHIDEIVISTLGEERSGWLRANLVERVKRATNCPVEHVVGDRTSEPEVPA